MQRSSAGADLCPSLPEHHSSASQNSSAIPSTGPAEGGHPSTLPGPRQEGAEPGARCRSWGSPTCLRPRGSVPTALASCCILLPSIGSAGPGLCCRSRRRAMPGAGAQGCAMPGAGAQGSGLCHGPAAPLRAGRERKGLHVMCGLGASYTNPS